MKQPQFQYVSSVPGHLVTRLVTLQGPVIQYIGATRRDSKVVWQPDKIVPIPLDEWQRNRREYEKAVATNALKRRTQAEYNSQVAQKKKAVEEAKALKATEAQKAAIAPKQSDGPNETTLQEALEPTELKPAPSNFTKSSKRGK